MRPGPFFKVHILINELSAKYGAPTRA